KIHRIAKEAVRLRIRAGRNRGGVYARHRWVDRVVAVEHDAAFSERGQIRHDLRGDVVGAETVDDNQEVAPRGWRVTCDDQRSHKGHHQPAQPQTTDRTCDRHRTKSYPGDATSPYMVQTRRNDAQNRMSPSGARTPVYNLISTGGRHA